jgi:hypothetical protein
MGPQLTITLDEDLAEQLQEARRTGTAIDEAVNEAANDAVRRVLKDRAPVTPKPFVVRSRKLGVPLIDLDCTGRALEMLDELEQK